ncbi:MAG: hypothetical protein ACREEL_11715 [Stellaceae bacterium]
MERIWIGIDFSSNRKQWNPGVKRSNIWIATLHERRGEIHLVSPIRPHELMGEQSPFDRLCKFLRASDFDAAAIDAPFSVPQEYLPAGGHEELIRAAKTQAMVTPPFPDAKWLVAYAASIRPLDERKPYRASERDCNVNVRSTLWAGPRGGAAFTAACLTLISKSGRPCWPWAASQRGVLVEAFPSAQLRKWHMPYQGYGKPESSAAREEILSSIGLRFQLKATSKNPLYAGVEF